MIDEKKLIEEIESLTVSMGGMQLIHTQAKQSVIKTIDEQPRVGEWIPCSERLPEDCQEVLVFVDGTIDIDDFVDGMFFMYDEEVIAWMPLPEPYKGENKDVD